MMQQRHRIPTIFNIYMLDVICCSLGMRRAFVASSASGSRGQGADLRTPSRKHCPRSSIWKNIRRPTRRSCPPLMTPRSCKVVLDLLAAEA